MNRDGQSFWDRLPLPALIALWLLAIIFGAVMVFLAFFNTPASPTGAQVVTAVRNTPTPVGGEVAGVAPTAPPTAPANPGSASSAHACAVLDMACLEYGIQSNAIVGDPDYTMRLIQDRVRVGWVKQQLKWGAFSAAPDQMDWSGFDRVVEAANAHGLRVMLSIVTAPNWSRPSVQGVVDAEHVLDGPPDDLNAYARFVGQVVDRYKGKVHAIEVWNEQNIDAEWKTNPQAVSPERYVEMLKLAYETIKGKDPNVLVISGALSPTGFFGGGCDARGCDDQPYLKRMTELGFLQYADCVGVHVNGYNLPPDKRHDEGYNDPTATFRGPFDNPHPSWSFRSTLEDYYAITGRQKPLCVTEFGWASYEGLSTTALASYEFGLDNTAQEQAEWDVQAFRLMREWGYVKIAFLFNLDFAQKSGGASDRTAPWSITDLDGAPRPALDAVGDYMKQVRGIP
jgi:hypothetical protein